MDCTTARRLLEFVRPHNVELDPLEVRAVEAHVAACPECSLLSKRERRLDEQLGQAMRKVDVPDRLRARLLTRLSEDRVASRKGRRRFKFGGVLAVAASLLLAAGIWLLYPAATLDPLDMEEIVRLEDNHVVNKPTREEIEKEFRAQGLEISAPSSLNYAFLSFHGTAKLQKKQVPCLMFINVDSVGTIHDIAKVYIVSNRQFNLKNLPESFSAPSYQFKVELLEREPKSPFVYVVVHTGDNIDWLRAQ